MRIEYTTKSIKQILDGEYCPFPVDVIPNRMGINLVSVGGISWGKQPDGQLRDVTIHFIPADTDA